MRIKKWIMDLPEYIPGSTLEEIKKTYGLEHVYKLASNENLWGPAPEVKQALNEAIENVCYYPDANGTNLRNKLSETLGVSPDHIIIGNGTDQIIEMVCDCLIGEGDNIVIADPTFLIYEKATLKCGGTVKKIPLKDYRQDIENMVKQVDQNTSIIFFTTPHNPTGTNITKKEFEYILSNIDKHVLVVIDEAYCEYVDQKDSIFALDRIRDFPNLLILRTFSKIYGLAGLRTGYGIAAPVIINALNKIRLPFNVNALGQIGACAALDHARHIQQVREKVSCEKEKFYTALKKHGIACIPSFANFLLINTGKHSPQIAEDLLKAGFIVRPGRNLGMDGFIRITISLPAVNDKFLEKFLQIYKTYY